MSNDLTKKESGLFLVFFKKSNKEGLHCNNISIPVKDSYKILKRLLWFSKHNDKRSKEEDSAACSS